MANVTFACDVGGWSSFLEDALRRVTDLTPIHSDIGDMLLDECQQNYKNSGGSQRWAPLHRDTLTPGRLKFGTKPLVRSGWLQRNMEKDVKGEYVDVGIDWHKALILFFGGRQMFKGAMVDVPARSPFDWKDGVLDRIRDMYTRFIMGVH